MKTNFTIFGFVWLLLTLSVIPAKSQRISQYSFNATPVLISGTANQVNAQYRFANVSENVDAIITIVSASNGATVDIFDDNTITKPEGFSPKIGVPANKTGMVEFQICFVAAGTMTSTVQDSLFATAIDIDGNAQVKEMDVIDLGGGISFYQPGTPEIVVTQSGTAFTGKNVAGNEYDGIDTSARQVMFTVQNNNVGCFTYKCGASNSGGSGISRQKSIYFKNFTYPPAPPLPVKYLSFEAVATNKSIDLKWVTVSEINNSHFEVERSFDMNDFKTAGIVLDGYISNGNDKNYAYKDNSPEISSKAIIYYRLKQVDVDGKFNYSNVLAVRFKTSQGSTMQVSPNPFSNKLTAGFTAEMSGVSEIRILSVSGQVVLSKAVTVNKGYNSITMDGLTRLNPGIYLAQLIENGKIIESQKIVKN